MKKNITKFVWYLSLVILLGFILILIYANYFYNKNIFSKWVAPASSGRYSIEELPK